MEGKFKAKNYIEAIAKYRAAMALADQMNRNYKTEHAPDGNESGMSATDLTMLKKTILQNMSICTNSTGHYKESITNLTKAIEYQS